MRYGGDYVGRRAADRSIEVPQNDSSAAAHLASGQVQSTHWEPFRRERQGEDFAHCAAHFAGA